MRVPVRTPESIRGLIRAPFTPIQTSIYTHPTPPFLTMIGARHYEPAIMFPFGNKTFKNASKLLLTFVPYYPCELVTGCLMLGSRARL
jgi:hypothetical protein